MVSNSWRWSRWWRRPPRCSLLPPRGCRDHDHGHEHVRRRFVDVLARCALGRVRWRHRRPHRRGHLPAHPLRGHARLGHRPDHHRRSGDRAGQRRDHRADLRKGARPVHHARHHVGQRHHHRWRHTQRGRWPLQRQRGDDAHWRDLHRQHRVRRRRRLRGGPAHRERLDLHRERRRRRPRMSADRSAAIEFDPEGVRLPTTATGDSATATITDSTFSNNTSEKVVSSVPTRSAARAASAPSRCRRSRRQRPNRRRRRLRP